MHTFHRWLIGLIFFLLLSGAVRGDPAYEPASVQAQTTDPVLVGAGDIAKCILTQPAETANLLDGIDGTVFTLGDNAYPSGTLAEFNDCYEPSWGRHKDRTRPSVGNHEYRTPGAAGYYTYFGSAASPLDANCTSNCKGYYTYNLGDWHIIVLNSEIARDALSEQVQWLRADLAANQTACTLAYWHKPRFSSGQHGNNSTLAAFWQALYDFGADVVLNGHDHLYERFGLQNPSAQADPNRGIRQFTVGTGGAALYTFPTIQPNSEVRENTTWGVLKLTLHANSYSWEFVPVAGQTFTDSGSANCVSTTPPANNPPVAADDTASTAEDVAVTIDVVSNDGDPDGVQDLDPTSVIATCAGCAQPTGGTLANLHNGTFIYTPNPNFNGSDSFVYQICDLANACDTANVSISISPTPDAPVANNDSASTDESVAVTINVAANDSDPDGGQELDLASTNTNCSGCSLPAHGALANNHDGSFTYTPTPNFSGPDSFIYEICDSGALCDTASVMITVRATSTDPIFSDGFESGDLSAWSSSATDAGDLRVSAAAAMIGANGLQAVIDDNIAIYVTDETPNGETRYRARFYFDPNSIPMSSGNTHPILAGYAGTNTLILRVEFRYYTGAYQLRAGLLSDATTWNNSPWMEIADGQHYVEIDWKASPMAGANAGGLAFWIDGVQRANLGGVDNDTRRLDRVRLGAISSIDNGTRGTYFLDAFESRRETYIGPAGVAADFAGAPTQGSAPLTVNFTNLSQPADRITSYLWDFGDGATSTETNPSHIYVTDGVYTVSLTAFSDLGEDSQSKTNYIKVSTGTDLIFSNGFEDGDFLGWTECVSDLGDLSVTNAAALSGSYGMRALIDDNLGIYCQDNSPDAEIRYRARFYFDPNTIPMVVGDNHMIFVGYSGTSTQVVRVLFRRYAGNYQARAALVNDGTTWTSTSWFAITDAPHFLEVNWNASSAAGANNGGLTFWIDGVQKASLSGIDNDTRKIDMARLGAVNSLDTGTRGTYYFDAFESRRETYIGP